MDLRIVEFDTGVRDFGHWKYLPQDDAKWPYVRLTREDPMGQRFNRHPLDGQPTLCRLNQLLLRRIMHPIDYTMTDLPSLVSCNCSRFRVDGPFQNWPLWQRHRRPGEHCEPPNHHAEPFCSRDNPFHWRFGGTNWSNIEWKRYYFQLLLEYRYLLDDSNSIQAVPGRRNWPLLLPGLLVAIVITLLFSYPRDGFGELMLLVLSNEAK